ncbi:MAG: kinase, partial [Deltaproteobacteria bacterium]
YTGLTRFASEIVKEQIKNTKTCSKDAYLERMHQMVFDAEKIISGDKPEEMVRNLGGLLHESWQLKKCLSSQITSDLIDDIYNKATQAGACGGKLAGAGGGGFLFFLTPKDKQEAVRKALEGLLEVNFKFENDGSKIIYLTH